MNTFPRSAEADQAVAISPWTKSSLSHANGNCVEVTDLSSGQVGRNGEFNFHEM